MDMDIKNIANQIESLGAHCDKHGLDVKRVRRAARNDQYPGATLLWADEHGRGGKWVIATDQNPTDLGDVQSRGASRDDGRKRFIMYATVNEHDAIIASNIIPSDCVIDPRVVARERRLERKNAIDDIDNV